MKRPALPLTFGALLAGMGLSLSLGQDPSELIQKHREAARAAAGQDLVGIYNAACGTGAPPAARGAGAAPAGRGMGPRPTPPREEWYAEPVKVFDNLYYLGTKVHGA